MRDLHKFFPAIAAAVFAIVMLIQPALADEASLRATLAKISDAKGFPQIEAVVRELGASGDAAIEPSLAALGGEPVVCPQGGQAIFIAAEVGSELKLSDPLTGAEAGTAPKADLTKIRVNNALRRVIREVTEVADAKLSRPGGPELAAADTLLQKPDPASIELLDAALAKETDSTVKARLQAARAAAVLVSDLPDADKSAAIKLLGGLGTREAAVLLTNFEAGASGLLKRRQARHCAPYRAR